MEELERDLCYFCFYREEDPHGTHCSACIEKNGIHRNFSEKENDNVL